MQEMLSFVGGLASLGNRRFDFKVNGKSKLWPMKIRTISMMLMLVVFILTIECSLSLIVKS